MMASTFRNGLAVANSFAADSYLPLSLISPATSSPPFSSPAMKVFLSSDDLPKVRALLKILSPSCVSIIVVVHLYKDGSGGRLTRVNIPGTCSEKCLDTNVDMRLDLPTPPIILFESKLQRDMVRTITATQNQNETLHLFQWICKKNINKTSPTCIILSPTISEYQYRYIVTLLHILSYHLSCVIMFFALILMMLSYYIFIHPGYNIQE